jgi:CRISPR-associated endonuclease/helicase Cas3
VDADYLDTEEHFNPDLTRLRQNTTSLEKMWNLFQLDQENLMRANEQNTSIIQQIRSQSYNYALQSAEQTRTQGIFRLAIPTGGGKTRTSLAFALKHCLKHDLERIIIALPYTTIIEQTVKVYRQIFGENAVLEHHSALIPEENNEEDARFRSAQARLATENWNVPLVVTTTVQLFESLLSNRPSRCRKLHNLCKSVIILDEVQALPIELLAPILSVLKELNQRYGVTIVLCTATQPALEDSPYLAGFNEIIDIIPPQIAKRYFAQLARVNYHDEKATVTKSQLAERITHHEQALIILNTRKDAIELIQLLPEVKHIYHLSTLLCGRHRRKVLEEVRDRLQNNQPCLLISTQVVEAGVDLDFPVVYRAIAPMDRIIQSAGRCNREGKLLTRGDVFIIRLSDGGMPSGSYRHAYKTTETLLQEDWDWYNPDSYTRYFRRLYQTIDTDAHEIQKPRGCLNYPEVAQKFKMIPHQTFPVVIKHYPESQALVDIIKGRGLRSGDWQSLQPYLINLYQYDFHNARQQELLTPIAKNLWSWEGDYHPITGIGNLTGTIVKDPADLII